MTVLFSLHSFLSIFLSFSICLSLSGLLTLAFFSIPLSYTHTKSHTCTHTLSLSICLSFCLSNTHTFSLYISLPVNTSASSLVTQYIKTLFRDSTKPLKPVLLTVAVAQSTIRCITEAHPSCGRYFWWRGKKLLLCAENVVV